jgi:tetratricopeptide (TPR) repeat protein
MRQRRSGSNHGLAALLWAFLGLGLAADASAQPGRIGGVVKDDKGEPIKGATITADNENIGSSFTATTDDKGRFVIIGLRAGTWRFIAQAPGFAPDGGQMPVRSGAPNPPLTFALKRTGPAWTGAMAGITARDLQSDLAEADTLFTQKKWDEAIDAYRTIMNRAPALGAINLQIAAAYRGKKDYDGALAAYRALLANDPSNERAQIGISQTSLERGDIQAAEAALLEAASSPSAGREVFYHLAEVKSSKNETDEAAKWYEKASSADPSWGKPLYKLGVLAMNKGDTQNATTLFDRVLAVDPVSPEAALAKTSLDQLKK